MDYSNSNSDDNELWDWKGENYYLQKDSHLDIPRSLWEGDQNEHLTYVFDETTPVKACGDLAYNVSNSGKNTNKGAQEYKGYCSQVKRRRMLQFNTENTEYSVLSTDALLCTENTEYSVLSTDALLCTENTEYSIENLKDNEDFMGDVSPENMQWESGLYGGPSASGNGGLEEPAAAWLSNCFEDGGMHLSSDEMNFSGISDDQIDISEFCNIIDETESDKVQVCPTPPPNRVIYKGRKSYIRTPTNLASSVAYPFALIKPCGIHGDVTLKDINQRIHTPAPSSSKQDKDENPAVTYPTSAFSGKPVVVKTKIRTEGGKGSITIMRTKG